MFNRDNIHRYIFGTSTTENTGFLSRTLTEYERAHPWSRLFGRRSRRHVEQANMASHPPDSHVIDLEHVTPVEMSPDQSNDRSGLNNNETTETNELTNDAQQTTNDNNSEDIRHRIFLNFMQSLSFVTDCYTHRYAPFVSVFVIKWLYDYKFAVGSLVVLFITYNRANNHLKHEITKRQHRNVFVLLWILSYIIACIALVYHIFDTHIFSLYLEQITALELLLSIAITDFILKLVTIALKVALTFLPYEILHQRRALLYVVLEVTSQLYRCLAPMQGWSFYFLYCAYEKDEKTWCVLLLGTYIIFKSFDITMHFKQLCTAVTRLRQDVGVGMSPSKKEILESGEVCVICHEKYYMPVQIKCGHIFCEVCVSTWLDRGPTCPLCRADLTKELHDRTYRDGHTTHFIQLY